MTKPPTTLMTLQRIASMTFPSVSRFIISTLPSRSVGQWAGMLSLVGSCCLFAGCTNSEESVTGDGIIEPGAPMMVSEPSEVSGVDEPLNVPISPDVVIHDHRLRSAPDATLTPPVKSKFASSESIFALPPEPELQIGDAAPELRVQHWVRNRLERSADQSTPVQIIMFWATWSEPAIAAVERLPLLQNRFGDEIEIIGVSSETPEAVHGFLNSAKPNSSQRWKDHLGSVALAADHRGETEETFLLAGYEQGLPTSFVINREGIIAWIGAADQCEPVVAKVLAEEWDVTAAREAHRWAQCRKAAQRDIRDRLALARVSNDGEECVRLIDGLLEKFPDDVEFQMLRLQYLLRFEMTDAANKQSAALLSQLQDDSLRLNQLAWTLAENSAVSGLDLSSALSAAERAVELTSESDASSLETLARVRFRRGETSEAIEAQSMALRLAPQNKSLADTLEAFRKSTQSPVRKVGFYGSLM